VEGKGPAPVHLVVQDGLEAFLPMSGLVDIDKELARLSKQQVRLTYPDSAYAMLTYAEVC
jgi:phage I-like protein